MSESNELIIKENPEIRNMIHIIRGQQVMLDSDLAELYGYTTKRFNEQVKRNKERFPEDFMFQLTENELDIVRSHFATSPKDAFFKGQDGGRRYLPFVFTEEGIYMLSAVLKSEIAIQQSIVVMRAFKEMRHFLAKNSLMLENINKLEIDYKNFKNETNNKFKEIFTYISEHEEENQKIFYNGQIFDAFRILIDLVKKANSKIILIDNYVDVATLNILAKKNEGVDITIYTAHRILTKIDVDNFNVQYPTLEIKKTRDFHDRFLVIDNEIIYFIGASLKDAGKKCFAISKIEDKKIVAEFINKII